MTIVMYRIKDRKVENDKVMKPEINFAAHYDHANDHEGDVLFTTNHAAREKVDRILLVLSQDEQLIGDIVAYGKYNHTSETCSEWSDARTDVTRFTVPSQWEDYHKSEIADSYAWYEITNLQPLEAAHQKSLFSKANPNDNFEKVYSDRSSYHGVIYLEERVDLGT